MSWSSPRTWVDGELITASLFNTHVRDNTYVEKTNIDDLGALKTAVQTFGYSSGQGNAAGAGDTPLTGYDVLIRSGFLSVPGEAIILTGTFFTSSTAGTKTVKLGLGAGALKTLFTTTTVSTIISFQYSIRFRSSTACALAGRNNVAAHLGALASQVENAGMTDVNFAIDQTLRLYSAGTVANEIVFTDYTVDTGRSVLGATV